MQPFLSIVDVNQILQQDFDMYWSEQKILEFIRKFEEEPILWNPKHPSHKRMKPVFDAWVRIKKRTGWGCTIHDLKRKRASLLAYYRHQIQMKKISMQTNSETADKNNVNWFAFGALHRFLQPIYDSKQSIKITKNYEELGMTPAEEHKDQTGDENTPRAKRAHSQNSCSNDQEELFGRLIVNKLRRIQNTNSRELLMNNIHNMIFKACMEDRLKKPPE